MTTLSLAEFWDSLKIERLEWGLRPALQTSGLGDGSVLRASVGPTLWVGTARLARLHHRQHDGVLARLAQLADASAFFMAYDVARPGPADDPDGSALGAATPTLDLVNVGTSRVKIAGLPAGYRITAGDLIAFEYGSPARHALHRAVETVTADAAGLTPRCTIAPAVRTGAALGDPVTLVKPAAKFLVAPGSVSWGESAGMFTRGVGFSFVQTLR